MFKKPKNTDVKVGDELLFLDDHEVFTVNRIEFYERERFDKQPIMIYVVDWLGTETFYHGGNIGDRLNKTMILKDWDLGI